MNFTIAAGLESRLRSLIAIVFCYTLVCTRPNFSPRKRALRLAQGVAVMTWTTKILIGALLLVAAAYGVHVFRYKLTVSLPDIRQSKKLSGSSKIGR